MLIRIDPESEAPLFAQVSAAVRAEIVAGRVGANDRLPAAREVATALQINVHTVLRAYQELRDEGLIELRRGRGAVVTSAAASVAALHHDIVDLATKARAVGVSPEALAALVKEIAHDR